MKKLIFLLLSFCFLFLIPKSSFAHILQTNGSIGVIYHLEPDHNPVVGEPAFLSFDITDKQNLVNTENCKCVVEIYREDKIIHTQNLSLSSFSYIFPKRGIYKVVVRGETFKVEYDQRVDRGGEVEDNVASATNNNFYLTIVIAGIILFVVLVYFKIRKK